MIVEFRPPAQHELIQAGEWYLREGGRRVAEQFEGAVSRALALLAVMPSLGTPSYGQARLWPLRRFPYTLVYRVQGEMLTVLAVAHQSRSPEYWVGRS